MIQARGFVFFSVPRRYAATGLADLAARPIFHLSSLSWYGRRMSINVNKAI